jgi:anti-sigma regulatory factor (Ser/Thr protein kinase)
VGAEDFDHVALVYRDEDGFLEGTVPFVNEGLESDGAVLVAVSPDRIHLMKQALGVGADRVSFVDMHELGRNPARIIPAWRAFVAEHADRPIRGVGEPIWAERSSAELDECHRHEALLNHAFDGGRAWRLLCPYDAGRLPPEVVEHARTTHRAVLDQGQREGSGTFRAVGRWIHEGPLPPVPASATSLAFAAATLADARHRVRALATSEGLDPASADDLALAVNEVATNSLEHGTDDGHVWLWADQGALYCEVTSPGRIEDPLAGRRAPTPEQVRGRGLWIANAVCDLVQIRTTEATTTIRLQKRR